MRHLKRTAKLGRTDTHRNAMLANLVCSLIKHGRVTTTLAKAKAARGASAGRAREIQMMLLLQHGRESVQATLGERQIIGAQAFLGTVDPCATLGTQQRILHINGNCDFR